MVTLPAETPDTDPEEVTVAIVVELVVQDPPLPLSDKVTEEPAQTLVAPEMVPALAAGLTVSDMVATAVPQ